MKRRILLAEDEKHIRATLKMNLEMEGYTVTCAENGLMALEKYKMKPFDLIILDVMMPEMDGFSVCQTIRLENEEVPILFLTAKNSGQDRIKGLKIGADDYLAKPFNLEEFLLRVEKLLNRSGKTYADVAAGLFQFGDNKVNFKTYEIVCYNGVKRQLTKREIKLLKLLTDKKNQVVSRQEILDKIWGYDVYPMTRTIDNFILAFRKYFEPDPKSPRFFQSVRGVGYKFVFEGGNGT